MFPGILEPEYSVKNGVLKAENILGVHPFKTNISKANLEKLLFKVILI